MTTPLPRLLLVEDDAVSRQFLAEALASLPARVDVAASVAEASALAGAAAHVLWLVDAHLPDGDGIACLQRLRLHSDSTTAAAITAETGRDCHDRLLAAGFAEVLAKPISAGALQANVRRLAGLAGGASGPAVPADAGKLPCWDDAPALAALNGNRASLEALRSLFRAELPETRRLLRDAVAAGDGARVHAIVHRLRASCGFVGAARLAAAVRSLSESPLDARCWQRLEFAAEDLLASDHS